MSARALMFQGTGSDVGKSLVVAGLCRAFAARGLEVRPFKPQNMSNNAAVTADGGEIGRAQALQARACRIAASVHMNPVLLKPQSEIGAQVVVRGRVVGAAKAREYQAMKPRLMAAVLQSFGRLKAEADLVLVEGAGSASEVNLRSGDIANMGFARAADTPVIMIGDIDRGGVIAQIVGTKVVIAPEDAAMVVGFLINKFRGDPSLFAEGLRLIEERTLWPSLGMIPHFAAAQRLPAEDGMALERAGPTRHSGVTIAVPRLARIANFDEFDPLSLEPNVDLVMVAPGEPLPVCDLVILPGSKATIADLAFFRAQGWDIDLFAHVRRGGRVLGLCGGYQMLGRRIADPEGAEGPAGEVAGLGLLDVETTVRGDKTLVAVAGTCLANGARFEGYEMHIGRTTGPATARPLLRYPDGRQDGAISQDGLIMGAYAHGLFAADSQRAAWLATLGVASELAYEATVERTLDELAAHVAEHVDLDRLIKLARY
ncbi:MAG: adenosylcobyric acid synthase [Alphaproteobacteria bacterium]|nr:adenosylcobyric acid synthase [Alphaproteobacteria bacterium]